jgi:hypothetical protein
MPGLRFVDSAGVEWEVYEVPRVSGKAGAVRAGLEQGWLSFASGVERRRLAPYPAEWQRLSPEQLEALRGDAMLAAPPRFSGPERRIAGASAARGVTSWSRRSDDRPDPATLAETTAATVQPTVQQIVARFARDARTNHQAVVPAMIALKAFLAKQETSEGVTDPRLVRRWFVDAYYFDRR